MPDYLEKPSPQDLAPTVPADSPQRDPRLFGYVEEEGSGLDLRELWRIVRRHKLLILSLVTIVTTLVAIRMYQTRNIYQAETIIEIGKENSSLVKAGDVLLSDDFDPHYLINIKTKMLMLQSRALLEDVVVDLKLDQNPQFLDPNQKRSSLSDSGNKQQENKLPTPLLEEEMTRSPEESARLTPYVDMVAAGLKIEQIRDTRALKISYTHTDPTIAALVANGISKKFRDRNYEGKTERFKNALAWLERTTRALKADVEKAEQALADYTREKGIFSLSGEGKETLTVAKLSALHDQATRAEVDRRVKESIYEEVKQGRVTQLPEVFADLGPKTSHLAELQAQLVELRTRQAQLSVKYGPENPQLLELQEQMAAIQKQIKEGTKTLEEKLKSDYERALRDEQSLKVALERAKAEAARENQSAIIFNLLKQDVETTKSLYNDFLQKAHQARVQVVEQYSNIRVIEPAKVPRFPAGPKRLITIAMGFILSLIASIGLAFLLTYLDNTIKSIDDVTRYAQLPTLAVIPSIGGKAASLPVISPNQKNFALSRGGGGKLVSIVPPLEDTTERLSFSTAVEAYRVLRTSVLLSTAGGPPKTVLFTSSQPGEGKTTTTINTAISLANLGASVLIVDADMRRPRTHKVFGVSNARGLSTYLSRNVELEELIQPLPIPNLSLLVCGPIPPNPAELVGSERMKDLLRILSERYNHILIDSPPIIHVTDPVILSTLVDGVILVVYGGKSKRDVLRRARQELAAVGARTLGVVLNNLDLKREGYDDYYYYRYYSSYDQDGTRKVDM